MDSTSFSMARKLPFARLRKAAAEPPASSLKPARITTTNPLRPEPALEARLEAKTEPRRSESLSSIYLTTGGDVAIDGGHLARWLRRLSPTARFRAAGGRLPNHSGGYVLSRCQPWRDGLGCNRSSGAAVRSGPGPQSDDFHEFRREFHHCFAVLTRPEHRRSGTGRTTSNHRTQTLSPSRSAGPADL